MTLYSTLNPRHLNLGLNAIDNQQNTAVNLGLMTQHSKITGKNTICGVTSGSVTAKKKIRPSGAIATTINHRQNAVSGRSYLPSDGQIL